MGERGSAKRMVLQVPVVLEAHPDLIAYWPVIIVPGNRNHGRTTLRMALDARVIRRDAVHPAWVQDVVTSRARDMFAPGPVTFFATHIPLCHPLGFDVVAHRMAPVTQFSGGTLHVVRRIVWLPP